MIRRLVFLTNFRLDAEQENTKFRVDDEWKNWRVITRVERDLALGCVTYVIIREGTILDGVKFTRFKVQLATKLARLRHSLPPLHLFFVVGSNSPRYSNIVSKSENIQQNIPFLSPLQFLVR